MKAYSLDLRERVVAAYEKGKNTIAEVAGQFSVGETFLKKMLRQTRLLEKTKKSVSPATIRRALQELRLRRKKNRSLHRSAAMEKAGACGRRMKKIARERLKFNGRIGHHNCHVTAFLDAPPGVSLFQRQWRRITGNQPRWSV